MSFVVHFISHQYYFIRIRKFTISFHIILRNSNDRICTKLSFPSISSSHLVSAHLLHSFAMFRYFFSSLFVFVCCIAFVSAAVQFQSIDLLKHSKSTTQSQYSHSDYSSAAVASPTAARSRHFSHLQLHESPRSTHSRSTRIFGSIYETYLMDIQVAGDSFTCILDTGSSDFAISADPTASCRVRYTGVENGKCTDGVDLTVAFGDGNFTGKSCNDIVTLNNIALGNITFASMETTFDMLECGDSTEINCIIGLAFPNLMGPPDNYSKPFFDLMVQSTGIPAEFGLQCCGWTGKESTKYAHGAIDFGFANTDHFTGDIVYTPLTREMFFGVRLLDVKLGNQSVMPAYNQSLPPLPGGDPLSEEAKISSLPPVPETIIDSGTSNILFTLDIWNGLISELKAKSKFVFDEAVWKGELCISNEFDINEILPVLSLTFPLAKSDSTADSEPTGSSESFDVFIPPCRYFAIAPASECKLPATISSLKSLPNSHYYTVDRPGWAFSLEGEDGDGIIAGQILYETLYVNHDVANHRIGFAPIAGCKKDSCDKVSRKYYSDWPGVNQVNSMKLSSQIVIEPELINSAIPISRGPLNALTCISILSIAAWIIYQIRQKRQQSSEYEPIPEQFVYAK